MNIGIIGLGVVGGATNDYFLDKGINVIGYDKYKKIGNIENTLSCEIIFLCLPTPFDIKIKKYDKSSIHEVCKFYSKNKYKGLIVLKSTVEPETTENLYKKYKINIVHNPEFLTAKTAKEDVRNQGHIVIGIPNNIDYDILVDKLKHFYNTYNPDAEISLIKSNESELMKLSVNSFYAVKIQFFNEIYLLCNNLDISYNIVKKTMLKNNWINKMHTNVPGTDGKLSYGGMCFPKDTNALNEYLSYKKLPNKIIDATIKERNKMRNVINKPIKIKKT